jgi:hypothetical protein
MVEVGSDLVCSSKSRLVSGVSVHDASTVALRTFNSIQPVCDLKVKDISKVDNFCFVDRDENLAGEGSGRRSVRT